MLKFNETKELQRVIKADLDSQNYKGEPGFESNLYYHLAGGNVPTFEVDTKYDNYKTRLDAFVREFVKADVHVLE